MIVSDALRDLISKMPQYRIQIGVFTTNSKRKTSNKHVVNVGITNAELMFIHENGSPLRKIPARPVLHMTIDWANTQIQNVMQKALKAYLQHGEQACETELKKFCLRMENYARDIIYKNDGRLAPNAPSVAKAKGGSHPLFDTGQLARSITCQLVKA